jgi:hypothetical protein
VHVIDVDVDSVSGHRSGAKVLEMIGHVILDASIGCYDVLLQLLGWGAL